MYNRFKDLGIPTVITRTSDTTLNPTDRINTIKPNITSSDDIVISNHLNAGGGDGAEIVYALRNNDTLSKMILNNIEETGQNIRKWYQRKLPSNQTQDYYYIIRNTSPAESVLIEYAFLDSTKDDHNQIKNDWEKWSEAVVKAVAEYKGYNYVPPGENIVNDTYVVQKGDSLWSIANANNTTIDELVNLNDLVTNTIYVGQILQIPNTGDSGVNVPDIQTAYVVQKGDTLYSIAKRYNTTPSAIIDLNGLTTNTLMIGQILTIPGDIESTGEDIQTNIYVVQKGDSLYSIAREYGVSVERLKEENGLTTDILTVGQILTIPETSNNTTNLYVVQKGDSLWSIANRFSVSINAIRMINNLTSDVLSIGQTLIIP